VLVVRGEAVSRRVVVATLAGRLPLVGGRLAVQGSPLPTGASEVMRTVAIAEGSTDVPTGGTAGELIAARLDATRPWYRLRPSSALVDEWVTRAADAVGHTLDGPPFGVDTPIATLGAETRAVIAVAAALAERPKVVVIDLDDDPSEANTELWDALARLVPSTVTLVVGIGAAATLPDVSPQLAARGIRTIEPDSAPDRVGALQEALR